MRLSGDRVDRPAVLTDKRGVGVCCNDRFDCSGGTFDSTANVLCRARLPGERAELAQFYHLGLDLELGKLAPQGGRDFIRRRRGPGSKALAHRAQGADDLLMPGIDSVVYKAEVGVGQHLPLYGARERGEQHDVDVQVVPTL